MHAEATLVPLLFFGSVFAFPLVRRQLIHRHEMERLAALRPALPAPESAAPPAADDAPALALRLPEPHRQYALALLCRLQDAPYDRLDPQAQFLLRQARLDYLPATLRAYLHLTPAGRQQLLARGYSPEAHLQEQLETIARGVTAALGLDQTAAQHLLTQGRFLKDRFEDGPGTVREYLRS
ncbi:hypothetical protein HNQ07_000788 [Deinococcus metalli]|uniref:Uncharacterized protein n=1 Tax=Deinococcus metalli TaxID=1141878 RepID=A0A7W8KF45_9DEIO|nr:hypothetical protein [Deinococcus metalli]MBB5375344.1 hypothetical protein [Deinococcus metalli]GHF29981.1 hypothetical protein GCM10017781_02520 [Deinococcus metalli]